MQNNNNYEYYDTLNIILYVLMFLIEKIAFFIKITLKPLEKWFQTSNDICLEIQLEHTIL